MQYISSVVGMSFTEERKSKEAISTLRGYERVQPMSRQPMLLILSCIARKKETGRTSEIGQRTGKMLK